jgi:hypothetical protein
VNLLAVKIWSASSFSGILLLSWSIPQHSYISWNSKEMVTLELRHAVAQLVEVLRYKPEGRGFGSR